MKTKKHICWARGCSKEVKDEDSLLCEKHKKAQRPINLKIPGVKGFDNVPQ